MEYALFKSVMKKKGKKDTVVSNLIRQVERFESFLKERGEFGVDKASVSDIDAFAAYLEIEKKGSSGPGIRGLVLYYAVIGMDELSARAAEIRENQIRKKRSSFPLREFVGIEKKIIDILAREGIRTVPQMIAAGSNPEKRKKLEKTTDIVQEKILELVKLSDLARLFAVKGIRARLYYNCGLDTPEKIAVLTPEKMLEIVRTYVRKSGFKGIPTLPKEAEFTIESAKKLKNVVEY